MIVGNERCSYSHIYLLGRIKQPYDDRSNYWPGSNYASHVFEPTPIVFLITSVLLYPLSHSGLMHCFNTFTHDLCRAPVCKSALLLFFIKTPETHAPRISHCFPQRTIPTTFRRRNPSNENVLPYLDSGFFSSGSICK